MISFIHTQASYEADVLQLKDVSNLPKVMAGKWQSKNVNTELHALHPCSPLNGDGDQSSLPSPRGAQKKQWEGLLQKSLHTDAGSPPYKNWAFLKWGRAGANTGGIVVFHKQSGTRGYPQSSLLTRSCRGRKKCTFWGPVHSKAPTVCKKLPTAPSRRTADRLASSPLLFSEPGPRARQALAGVPRPPHHAQWRQPS